MRPLSGLLASAADRCKGGLGFHLWIKKGNKETR